MRRREYPPNAEPCSCGEQPELEPCEIFTGYRVHCTECVDGAPDASPAGPVWVHAEGDTETLAVSKWNEDRLEEQWENRPFVWEGRPRNATA